MNQLMTPPRNYMNQKDPLSFSNRPAHADPRDLHRPQLQPSGKLPSRFRSYGITSRGTRLPESRREQDQKQREGRRKGLHVTTSYRKEKSISPTDGGRGEKEQEKVIPSIFDPPNRASVFTPCDGVGRLGRSKRENRKLFTPPFFFPV